MHFYFDVTLQFLTMKKDLKLHFYLLYMYKKILFVYPTSFVSKRVTSTKEVNIFLEQVSINICKTLDWVVCLSDFPFIFCYLGPELSEQSNSPPTTTTTKTSLLCEKTEASTHKTVKSTLVIQQNTVAQFFNFLKITL